MIRRYFSQLSYLDTLSTTYTQILSPFGMTKYTPKIDQLPAFGSDEWSSFTDSIWYGELEFYFSTLCGMLLSVMVYYGRTAEEVDQTENGGSQIHHMFMQKVFPQLLQPKHDDLPKKVERREKRATAETLYRVRHTERM